MDWNEWFLYSDGELLRKKSIKGTSTDKVGWINSSGYYQLELSGKAYMLHRVIYEMHNGPIPDGFVIDHIDRNPLNNRIENLRMVSPRANSLNRGRNSNNTTGYRGAVKTPSGKFQARANLGGVKLYLGLFDTAEEASKCVERFYQECSEE